MCLVIFMFIYRDMKTLNINELREQIAEFNKKLNSKASQDDLEVMKIAIREEIYGEIEKLKQQI